MIIGKKEFDTDRHTYIMGILNVTPDSFSDGGRFLHPDAALRHAEEMIKDGADILDIGGESTRPGHTQITDEEEISRTAPVVEKLKQEFDIPVSIDTYKSAVAEAALQAGADLVNDIWGLKYDARMAALIARYGAACCLMHNREEPVYLDPGVGFGKTYEMNLKIIREVGQMQELGYPILLGTSRKSVIGLTLNLPADQREEGTLATTVYGMLHGCSFVRVHDVAANRRAIQMTEAIVRHSS